MIPGPAPSNTDFKASRKASSNLSRFNEGSGGHSSNHHSRLFIQPTRLLCHPWIEIRGGKGAGSRGKCWVEGYLEGGDSRHPPTSNLGCVDIGNLHEQVCIAAWTSLFGGYRRLGNYGPRSRCPLDYSSVPRCGRRKTEGLEAFYASRHAQTNEIRSSLFLQDPPDVYLVPFAPRGAYD